MFELDTDTLSVSTDTGQGAAGVVRESPDTGNSS